MVNGKRRFPLTRWNGFSSRNGSIGGAPESVAGGTAAAAVVAAARSAGNLCAVVPGSSAPHSKPPDSRALGVNGICSSVRTIPICHPLPYVSQHVVNTEGIRLLLRDHVSCRCGVGVIPRDVLDLGIARSHYAAPRRIFPFGLRWKPHLYALTIDPGIVPGDLFDWQLRSMIGTRIAVHHFAVRRLRDSGLPYPEPSRKSHGVCGFFAIETFGVIRRTTHPKSARRNPDIRQAVHSVHLRSSMRRDSRPGALPDKNRRQDYQDQQPPLSPYPVRAARACHGQPLPSILSPRLFRGKPAESSDGRIRVSLPSAGFGFSAQSISMPLMSALFVTDVNVITICPLAFAVAVNCWMLAIFSPLEAFTMSKFASTCVPLMLTLNTREPVVEK